MNLPSNRVALDSRGLDDLKRTARESPDKALRAAATQFEALFMNMILKSMRDGLPKDGLTSSSAGDTYTGMLDQQLSQKLAGQGTGLADMLVKQLGRSMQAPGAKVAAGGARAATPAASAAGASNHSQASTSAMRARSAVTPDLKMSAPTVAPAPGTQPPVAAAKASAANTSERKRDFVARMADHAKAAEQQTGVPARFMIGQAALESGWGRKEIKDGSGQSAHNVFGIKATGSWRGPTVDVTTTEFVDGVAKKVVEKFRAYASYAEGFADYAKVIAGNPRYANVLKTARHGIESFAQGLQRAGYATDPAYATKLARVINDAGQIDRQA